MIIYVIVGAIGPAGSGSLPPGLEIFRLFSPIKPGCEDLCISELSDSSALSAPPGTNVIDLAKVSLQRIFSSCVGGGGALKGCKNVNANPVLENLGIGKDVTIHSSMMMLGKMIVAHSAIAWLGLIINSRSE